MDETRWLDLLRQQKEQEDQMRSEGAKRFKARLEAAVKQGQGSQAGAARKLLQMALEPTEQEIARRLAVVKPGKKHIAEKWVPLVGETTAAYFTAMAVLDGGTEVNVSKAAMTVADYILDDVRFSEFFKRAPHLFEYRMDRIKTMRYGRKVEAMDWTIKQSGEDLSDLSMSRSHKMALGVWLLDAFSTATGLVTLVQGTRHKRGRPERTTTLVLTPETVKWMEERNAAAEFMFPVVMPMLVEPLEWKPGRRGGYRFGQRGAYPLVRHASKEQQEKLAVADMDVVYRAVNAIQSTAWRVNTKVLAAVKATPLFVPEPMPAKPLDIADNFESRKAWKRQAAAVHEKNRNGLVTARERQRVLKMATDLKDEERFYFAHNLDYRGRVYPLASALHPQGDDLCRGLLTFHEGKPIGNGGAWLAVHLANKLGETPEGLKVSKMTFEERVDWVFKNTEDITKVATNPTEASWWEKADEPYSFLAACFEWAEFKRSGWSTEFVSSLPIAMDGSCNGLQHFSALLRDEVCGAAVNLVPQSRPRDIYQFVADAVLKTLETEAASEPLAALWLSSGLVNRKLTKRNVMTFGYGSKKYGFEQQQDQYLKALDNWKEVKAHFTAEDGTSMVPQAARFIAERIWNALEEQVVSAFDGMAWMQQAARIVVKKRGLISWDISATGFPVVQRVMNNRKDQVDTWLLGKMVKPAVYPETDRPDVVRAVNCISPNYTHSNDAAALMLTVSAAVEEGVTHFAMVHDSYGTHACDTETLAYQTRKMFVSLYTDFDPIGSVAEQWRKQSDDDEEFPELPAPGNLDITGVMTSRYFFG